MYEILYPNKFFDYAKKRYQLMLDKESGFPAPWTEDPILQQYRFCNIFREDDKVTKWFRDNIRQPLVNDHTVLFATFVFRMFNLPETGETMLKFKDFSLFTDWENNKEEFRQLVKQQDKKITAAYMVKTPAKMDKVDGCLQIIDWFIEHCGGDVNKVAEEWDRNGVCLQYMTEWISQAPFMGPFMSYEVVTDLRHTCVGRKALDISSWANPGPGAARGLSRLCGLPKDGLNRHSKKDYQIMQELMQELLSMANKKGNLYWPERWPKWEMREVEHTLCEVDKYLRAVEGDGKPKQKYRKGAA